MNLLLTFDNNYTQHAGVVIASFLAHHAGQHSFYVISDHISECNQDLLRSITTPHNCQIMFYFVDPDIVRQFPIGKGTANTYVSIATYFRLFITEVLPKSVDRILYLDCDIVVDDAIDEMWHHTFSEGHCIYALEEAPTLACNGCQRLHYDPSLSYFNAGILLIDLTALRKVYNFPSAITFIQSNDIKFHDQDVLNGMLYDKKQFMPLKYNVMDSFLIKNARLPERYEHQREALFHPSIIHFSGPVKPWHRESKNPYTERYYHYLQLTPWKNYSPVRKYQTLKGRGIYTIKLIAKWLLELLHIRYYNFNSLVCSLIMVLLSMTTPTMAQNRHLALTDSINKAVKTYPANSLGLYQALYHIHALAQKNNIHIKYPDHVAGHNDKTIALTITEKTTEPLPLSEKTDFNGWTFKVTTEETATNERALFCLSGTAVAVNSSISKKMIDKGDFSSVEELKDGMKMLIIHDATPWTYRHNTPETYFPNGKPGTPWQDWDYTDQRKKYRDDILLIKDGIAQNKPIAPYDTPASLPICKYVKVSKNLSVFKNITMVCMPQCKKTIKLLTISNTNNLLLSHIKVDIPEDIALYNCSSITLVNVTNATIQDYTINHTFSKINKWGYGLDMNNVWNIAISHMNATAPQWGVIGNNNVNCAYLTDCTINRFDIHCYGRDISCNNCTFRNDNYLKEVRDADYAVDFNEKNYHIYNRFSSLYGTLTYQDCTFDGFYPFLTDYTYNIYAGCDVVFRNCTMTIYQRKYASLFKMGFWGAPDNQRAEHSLRCFHNVMIDGMTFRLNKGISDVYLFYLLDRYDLDRGKIREKIYHTSSLQLNDISMEDLSGHLLNNARLKECNIDASHIKYAQRVRRVVNKQRYGTFSWKKDNGTRIDYYNREKK